MDVATGQTQELVTPAQLLGGAEEKLSVEEKARRERMRIVDRGFTSYDLSDDGQRVLFPLSGKLYVYERRDRQGAHAGRRRSPGAGSPVLARRPPGGATSGPTICTWPTWPAGKERRLTRGG